MHVRQKKNRSGSVSVVIVDKSSGRYKEIYTIGVAKNESEIGRLVLDGREWIRRRELALHPELDFLTSAMRHPIRAFAC